jgi:hypothetical protein
MELTAPKAQAATISTLWLPISEPGSAWLAAFGLCALYMASMARDLSLYDSGELALAAVQLGLGHPPGQPLHTLLGHALTWLPYLSPLVAVNLASALPAALTLLPATSLAQTLLGRDAARGLLRGAPWLLGIAALHPSLWEPATRIEVYALATFFAVWAAARIAAPARAGVEASAPRAPAQLFHAGLALGLCASVNPMIALCAGCAFAPHILLRLAKRQLPTRSLFYALAGGVLGLAPYLYILAVARRSDVMVWGAPRDAASLWHYVALRDYVNNQQITAPVWFAHIGAWCVWAVKQLLFPAIIIGSLAHLGFGRRTALGGMAAPLALLLLVAAFSSNSVWQLDIPDYNGYLATGLWLVLAAVPALCGEILARGRRYAAGLIALSIAVCALVAAPDVLERTRHHDYLARTLSQHVLAEAPARAILITEADLFAGSLFYLQEAEHARPDVVVLAYGLSSSSWHWQRIYALHPELTQIALKGAGGKVGRVQRFLAAHRDRPVLVERFGLATELGIEVCPGGVYLRTGSACQTPAPPDASIAELLADLLGKLDSGSPGAAGAIAQTSYSIGEGLLRMGYPRAGLRVLLAGVPARLQPTGANVSLLPVRAPPFSPRLADWRRSAALGDPARNLFVAGVLLAAANNPDAAISYVRAAQRDGLPEAVELLERAH